MEGLAAKVRMGDRDRNGQIQEVVDSILDDILRLTGRNA
jgi:hypothetical protein